MISESVDGNSGNYWAPRPSLREPIAELYEVASMLDLGVGAHLAGDGARAGAYFLSANTEKVRNFIESMWGKRSSWPDQVHYLRLRKVTGIATPTPEARGTKVSGGTRRSVVQRDGFRCRYCGLPVIPASIRQKLSSEYPYAVGWGSSNASQHAAFQALWLQYDHVLPLSAGGLNDPSNVVVACAACNFMKWNYQLEELGLYDPRDRSPLSSCWDGLTRLVGGPEKCPL